MLGIRVSIMGRTVYEAEEPFVSREEMVTKLLRVLDRTLMPGAPPLRLLRPTETPEVQGDARTVWALGPGALWVQIWRLEKAAGES